MKGLTTGFELSAQQVEMLDELKAAEQGGSNEIQHDIIAARHFGSAR